MDNPSISNNIYSLYVPTSFGPPAAYKAFKTELKPEIV